MEDRKARSAVAGIILAGGQSRRMGRDKALLPLPGRDFLTFVQYLAFLLSDICDEKLLVARDKTSGQELLSLLDAPSWQMVCDAVPDQGPLMGLFSGLRYCHSTHALVLAVDMPLLAPDLLKWLCSFPLSEEILMPRVQGIPQTLLARYPRAVLPVLESCIAQGRRDVRALLEHYSVRFLEEDELRSVDPDLRSFLNVNTPQDLRAIEKLSE